MTDDRIKELLAGLESAKSLERENAWLQLKPMGEDVVRYLAEAYPKMRKAPGRLECVYHSIRYARTSEAAFMLGVTALSDPAAIVRYRACGLLAYSLRADAIPYLKPLLRHENADTAANARAAIDAIENKNHHFFIDRNHSGRSFWDVNPGDC